MYKQKYLELKQLGGDKVKLYDIVYNIIKKLYGIIIYKPRSDELMVFYGTFMEDIITDHLRVVKTISQEDIEKVKQLRIECMNLRINEQTRDKINESFGPFMRNDFKISGDVARPRPTTSAAHVKVGSKTVANTARTPGAVWLASEGSRQPVANRAQCAVWLASHVSSQPAADRTQCAALLASHGTNQPVADRKLSTTCPAADNLKNPGDCLLASQLGPSSGWMVTKGARDAAKKQENRENPVSFTYSNIIFNLSKNPLFQRLFVTAFKTCIMEDIGYRQCVKNRSLPNNLTCKFKRKGRNIIIEFGWEENKTFRNYRDSHISLHDDGLVSVKDARAYHYKHEYNIKYPDETEETVRIMYILSVANVDARAPNFFNLDTESEYTPAHKRLERIIKLEPQQLPSKEEQNIHQIITRVITKALKSISGSCLNEKYKGPPS